MIFDAGAGASVMSDPRAVTSVMSDAGASVMTDDVCAASVTANANSDGSSPFVLKEKRYRIFHCGPWIIEFNTLRDVKMHEEIDKDY